MDSDDVPGPVIEFVGKVVSAIIEPLIALIFVLAFAYFMWGLASFVLALGTGDETKAGEGKQHMLWGLIGLTIMVSVYAIIRVVLATFGISLSWFSA
ncbi:MAG: hypothetical protein KBD21_03015 [Candidatus Pacebacteria bacterium]|nr:hypothetical protein [Candidatus Paceibacterota bacterium]